MKNLLLLVSICALMSCSPGGGGTIELLPIFSDNMVLQQKTEAPVWGTAEPGRAITVSASWDGKKYKATTDPDGNWKVKVSTPEAGGPYTVTISDGQEIVLNNVMIGEVWICSGQSNMEMQLEGWGKINNYEQEIANANYPNIRLLQVKKNTSPQPIENFEATGNGWQICSPQTIADFSAVAYFFGRDINTTHNIPIGLIDSSWGGTYAEAWTSGESIVQLPELVDEYNKVSKYPLTKEKQQLYYEANLENWKMRVQELDPGFEDHKPVWAEANAGSGWKKIKVPGYFQDISPALKDFNGLIWFRKTIDIPAGWEGKELKLNLGAVDDNDFTYFNGVEIGRSEGWNTNREYKVPADLVKSGKAVIAVRVFDTGGKGGIWGEPDNVFIQLSDDDRKNIAGEWEYQIGINMKEIPAMPQNIVGQPNLPAFLYNAMINPVVPYSIRGAIWYQGESNTYRAYRYRDLFPLMIKDWRNKWGYDFPFYFVQLANFMKLQEKPSEAAAGWPELREAQLMTLGLENTGMAVTIDIGDANDIHPKNKQDVGKRLALWARAKLYEEDIPYSAPLYDSYKIEDNKIRISFHHTSGGLKAKDNEPLKGFAIAGADKKFYWADAVIDGNEIVVSSPSVSKPVAVRYAWAENPLNNLYNGADLPASPFRTDDWR